MQGYAAIGPPLQWAGLAARSRRAHGGSVAKHLHYNRMIGAKCVSTATKQKLKAVSADVREAPIVCETDWVSMSGPIRGLFCGRATILRFGRRCFVC